MKSQSPLRRMGSSVVQGQGPSRRGLEPQRSGKTGEGAVPTCTPGRGPTFSLPPCSPCHVAVITWMFSGCKHVWAALSTPEDHGPLGGQSCLISLSRTQGGSELRGANCTSSGVSACLKLIQNL